MAQDLSKISGEFPRRDAQLERLTERFGAVYVEPCEKIPGAIIVTPYIFDFDEDGPYRTNKLDYKEQRRVYATGHNRKIGQAVISK